MDRRTEAVGKRARTPIFRHPRQLRASGGMRASKRARKAWTVSAARFAVVGFRLALRTAASIRSNLTPAWAHFSLRSGRIRFSEPYGRRHLRCRCPPASPNRAAV
jgi:hypothetical protein